MSTFALLRSTPLAFIIRSSLSLRPLSYLSQPEMHGGNGASSSTIAQGEGGEGGEEGRGREEGRRGRGTQPADEPPSRLAASDLPPSIPSPTSPSSSAHDPAAPARWARRAKVKKNPLPWVEEMINAPTHTNFFENRATDYAKGALAGDWSEVWAQ